MGKRKSWKKKVLTVKPEKKNRKEKKMKESLEKEKADGVRKRRKNLKSKKTFNIDDKKLT